MTEAKAGYGTILKWNSEPIAEVSSITGPSLTIDQIDCTHYTSPQQFKEWIAGFGDGGEITFDCNFIPGDTEGQIAFIDDAYAKETRDVEVHLGDPVIGVWTFEGLVTKLDFTQPMDNKIGFAATIKISGVPELAIEESGGLTGLLIEGSESFILIPTFNNAIYLYNCEVNTGTDEIIVTATAAGHTIRCRFDGGDWIALVSTTPKPELAIGPTNSVTELEIQCWQADKIRKTYKVYIARPAGV